ncbi:MAG: Zn-ribbon domain-containing OB-fold protein [Chloroflexi bacterium]|nr:Zn-ribbon domain-containing OB-fold protein [Chloroflexota bacterium]
MPDFPTPLVTPDTAPFWKGCQAGQLLLQRCAACGALRYPPRPMCPQCTSKETGWVPASGRGTVYSYTVTHQALHPSLADKVPHLVILVELEEGVRITSNIVDCPPDQVRIGMPVEVVFHQVNPELTLPKFRPAGTA